MHWLYGMMSWIPLRIVFIEYDHNVLYTQSMNDILQVKIGLTKVGLMYTINIFMTITKYRNVEIIMDFKMLIEGHLIWMRWGTWIFENCLVVIVTQELVLKKRVGAITISIFIFNENIKMNIIHKIFKPYVGISLIMDPNLSFEGQNDKHLFLL